MILKYFQIADISIANFQNLTDPDYKETNPDLNLITTNKK